MEIVYSLFSHILKYIYVFNLRAMPVKTTKYDLEQRDLVWNLIKLFAYFTGEQTGDLYVYKT